MPGGPGPSEKRPERGPGPSAGNAGGARGAGARREGLPAHCRLLRRDDYLRCYRTGRRRVGELLMLYFAPNALGHPRLGITASRKVGNSVIRHRLKRRIKEVYRRWPRRDELSATDLVVHLKPEAKGAGFHAVADDLLGLLGGVAARQKPAGRAADQGKPRR